MGKKMSKTRVVVNICLVVAVVGAWTAMFLFGEGSLSDDGLSSLKYFTVLSNLFEGIASLIWLIAARKGGTSKDRAERLKYVAATSVFLTFTTVMVFLGPLYGYPMMFEGSNLFFHLLIPIAAVLEIIFLSDRRFDKRDNNIAAIPPVIYGLFYLGNVIINGVGEWPDTNDWYLFLAWGYPVGILIFAVITITTWLLALLLRKVQRAGRGNEISEG